MLLNLIQSSSWHPSTSSQTPEYQSNHNLAWPELFGTSFRSKDKSGDKSRCIIDQLAGNNFPQLYKYKYAHSS
ncbi:MAG: hypothetical protein CL912_30615 [Deltaproteobacteria bacterium]|nr:hypothetical protein [Deltaproteobacteria bacterium]